MVAIEEEQAASVKIMEIELESAKKDGKMITCNLFGDKHSS